MISTIKKKFGDFVRKQTESFNAYLESIPLRTKIVIGIICFLIFAGFSLFFGDAIIYGTALFINIPAWIVTYVYTGPHKTSAPRWVDRWTLWSSIYHVIAAHLVHTNEFIDAGIILVVTAIGISYLTSKWKSIIPEKMIESITKKGDAILSGEDEKGAEEGKQTIER